MLLPNLYSILKDDLELKSALGVDKNSDIRFYINAKTEDGNNFDKYAYYSIDNTEFQTKLDGGSDINLFSISIVVVAKTNKEVQDISSLFIKKLEDIGNFNSLTFDYDFETRQHIANLSIDIFL